MAEQEEIQPDITQDAVEQVVTEAWERHIFRAYLRIQYGGKYNMVTEGEAARREAILSREEYLYVIQSYGELEEKYPDLVTDAGNKASVATWRRLKGE